MVISIMREYQLKYLQQHEVDEITPLKERWRKVRLSPSNSPSHYDCPIRWTALAASTIVVDRP